MLSVLLGTLLVLQSASPPQQQRNTGDTRQWYQAYADAMAIAAKATRPDDWNRVIADLDVATSRRGVPRPGRQVTTAGDQVTFWIPDYYYGIAYYNLGRFKEADAAFKRAVDTKLIRASDSISRELNRLAPLAATNAAGAQPSVATNTPAGGEPTVNASVQGPVPPLNTSSQVSVPYDPPTSLPGNGVQPNGYQPASPTGSKTGGQTTSPPTISSKDPVAQKLVARATNVAPALAPDVRAAMISYFSGDYAVAEASLNQLIATKSASPRAYFYLACSRVARSLTVGGDVATVTSAKAALASAGDTSQFAADLQVISPRIAQQLGLR